MFSKGLGFLLVSFLAGCGGGAGGAIAVYVNSQPELAAHDTVAPATLIAPQPLAAMPRAGVPSAARDATGYGLAHLEFAGQSLAGWAAAAETIASFALLPTGHLHDTAATTAWAEGWTGLGQTIAVIDDFSDPIESHLRVTVPRSLTAPDGARRSYDVTYEIPFYGTHGQLVENIAGGDADPPQGLVTQPAFAVSAVPSGCIPGAPGCAALDGALTSRLLDQSALRMDYAYVAGVASEATIQRYPVDLSVTQNSNQTLAAILSAVDSAADAAAINLSVGSPFRQTGFGYESYADYLLSLPGIDLQRASDAVIAVAAGNEAEACGSDLIGCNLYAVAATILPETRANVIVVGATQGTGAALELADYSNRAGVLQQRFLVASGETGMWVPDASGALKEIVGTSFAAPRVAGAAAILRQKFPDLSGAEAASVLLLTASKDINADGRQDFEGTSAIYGQGRLDLPAALSPIGALALR